MEKITIGIKMANTWTDPTAVIIITLVGGIPAWIVAQVMIAKYFGIVYVPLLTLAIYLYYDFVHLNTPPAETTKYVEFKVARRPTARPRPARPPRTRLCWASGR